MTPTSLFDVFLQPTGSPVDLSAVEVIDPAHRSIYASLEGHSVFRFLSGDAPLDQFPVGAAYLQDDRSLHVIYTVPGGLDLSYRLPAGTFKCPSGPSASARPMPDRRAYRSDHLARERAKIHRDFEVHNPAATILLFDRSHGSLSALNDIVKLQAHPLPEVDRWLTASDSRLLFFYLHNGSGPIGIMNSKPGASAQAVVAALRNSIATLKPPPFDQIVLAPQCDDVDFLNALRAEWVFAGGRPLESVSPSSTGYVPARASA